MESTLVKLKKSNLLWWVLGGASLLGIILFSSFSSSSGTQTDCALNPQCLLGFWKWQILRTSSWYSDIVKRATDSGGTIAVSLEANAQWMINNKTVPPTADFAAWQALVLPEINYVKSQNSGMSFDDARVIAINNVLDKLK